MDHDDDGETSYNTFVDDVAFEPTYSQALLTAAGRNVATIGLIMAARARLNIFCCSCDLFIFLALQSQRRVSHQSTIVSVVGAIETPRSKN